jgi:hypothetical protein
MGGILLLNGGTDELVEVATTEQCQVLTELSVETFLGQHHFLCISIHVVTSMLCQIVEPLIVLIDLDRSLLHVQKLLLLVAHKTCWNVMTAECLTEFSPQDLVVVLDSDGVAFPLGPYETS